MRFGERLLHHEADAGVRRTCDVCHFGQFQPRWTTALTNLSLHKGKRETCHCNRKAESEVQSGDMKSTGIRKCPDNRKTSRASHYLLALIGMQYAQQSSSFPVQTRRSYSTSPADTASLKLDASPGCVGRSSSDHKDTESSAVYRPTDVSNSRFQSVRRAATSRVQRLVA
jgi:hypothetical protein